MTVNTWSKTAATNATADSSINLREGQAPSTLNDSGRAIMAAIAKWRDDLSGNIVTGGSSTAYTITTNQSYTSLADGLMVSARMSADNGASPTLNVDSTGAKAIAVAYGEAVGSGVLKSGGVYTFVYDSTDDKWIVHGGKFFEAASFPAGTKMIFRQTAAPTGWTKDTTYTDAALRVTSGTISQQATSGKEFSSLLAARTITASNLPDHSVGVTITDPGHSHNYNDRNTTGVNGSGSGAALSVNVNATTTATTGITATGAFGTTQRGGSQTTMAFDVNYVDVIIATKD